MRHINAPEGEDTPESASGWVDACARALDAEVHGVQASLIPASYCFP